MLNDRRRLWTSILFVCFFAPFVAVFIIYLMTPAPKSQADLKGNGPGPVGESRIEAPASSNFTGPGGLDGLGGASLSPNRAKEPLLAVGDGRDVWVAVPILSDSGTAGFELLDRHANTGLWRLATPYGGQTFLSAQGFPRALMLLLPSGDRAGDSTPYIVGESGLVKYYGLDWDHRANPLPRDTLEVKAATGGANELFVITYGPDVAAATRPGDRLPPDLPAPAAGTVSIGTPASAPATPAASAAAEAAAVSTATAPGRAAPRAGGAVASQGLSLHVWWYPPPPVTPIPPPGNVTTATTGPDDRWHPAAGSWVYLPPIAAFAGDPASVPSSKSLMALAAQDGRLIAVWVDTARARRLMVRTLDYGMKNAVWSEPHVTELQEDVPGASRLFTAILDQTLYVLWTVPEAISGGSSIALHGGWMETDPNSHSPFVYQLPAKNFLKSMPLGQAGMGVSPATDVAVGASENSLVAVVITRDNSVQSLVFDNRGGLLASAAPVEPRSPRRDIQIGQNIAMILLALMLTLSLWQWRQKAAELTLPAGLMVAPVHLRVGAFLIDAVIPYIVVLIYSGTWRNSEYFSLISSWFSGLGQPEELIKNTELLIFAGLYVLHVGLGEMIFRRSIGKALLKMQILGLDGKPPTLAAILIRNLVRPPEMVVGIALLYVLVSDRHQRLGDLLARTVVVVPGTPETEKETPGQSRERRRPPRDANDR